jgi:dihydrofolate reductase
MSKVIFGMAMSLDGFVEDRDGNVTRLYPDMAALRNSELLQEAIRNTGAVVMGRGAYDMANGDFTDYEFQVPLFIITHTAPETVAKGENDKLSFTFVTDGLESAFRQAKAAAGDRDVTVVGGADIGQQGIKAGVFDEIQIDLVPVLLGGGLRLFDNLGTQPVELERIKVVEEPTFTHLRFRVVK